MRDDEDFLRDVVGVDRRDTHAHERTQHEGIVLAKCRRDVERDGLDGELGWRSECSHVCHTRTCRRARGSVTRA